jgi:hypothetical protein
MVEADPSGVIGVNNEAQLLAELLRSINLLELDAVSTDCGDVWLID